MVLTASISAALIYESRKYSEFIFSANSIPLGVVSPVLSALVVRNSQTVTLSLTVLCQQSQAIPSFISIGDSQTGHLRPILNRLHVEHGSGIMYYTCWSHVSFYKEIGSMQFDTLKKFDDAYFKHLSAYRVFSESARVEILL